MSSLALHHRLKQDTPASTAELGVRRALLCEGYSLGHIRNSGFLLSLLIHTLAIVALFTAGRYMAAHRHETQRPMVGLITDISPYILPPSFSRVGGGGGGGDRDKLRASKGGLPRPSRQQLAPPAVVVRNENPKLPVEPTVVVPPEIHLPQTGLLGDPLSSVLGPPSNGTGSGGGVGTGTGGGVGSGRGPGVGPGWGGGIGGGAYRVGGALQRHVPFTLPSRTSLKKRAKPNTKAR